MKRPSVVVLLFVWLLCMFVYSLLATDSFDRTAKVLKKPAYDTQGIEVYQLNFGADGGVVTILADDDTPFAKFLSTRDERRIRVVLEPQDQQAIER